MTEAPDERITWTPKFDHDDNALKQKAYDVVVATISNIYQDNKSVRADAFSECGSNPSGNLAIGINGITDLDTGNILKNLRAQGFRKPNIAVAVKDNRSAVRIQIIVCPYELLPEVKSSGFVSILNLAILVLIVIICVKYGSRTGIYFSQ